MTTLLLLIYFTVSTGFVVSFHYCMDRIDSFRIGNTESDTCGTCGMHQGENECCFDDVKIVKLTASHLASPSPAPLFSLPDAVVASSEYLLVPLINFLKEERTCLAHSPPLPDEQKNYIRNCVFRI